MRTQASITASLVRTARRPVFDGLPDRVRLRAVDVILDTLAAIKAGSADRFCAAYIDSLISAAGGGRCHAVRGQTLVSSELAAFVNALPATVHQIDEGHRRSRGHPGIHVVPAALAAAEEADADGAQLVEAVVAGYEVAVRIGLLLSPLPPLVHPHGAWGAFGAVVAALRIRGASDEELALGLDAVASIALHPYARTVNDGATIHHLFAATGTQLGVTVARAVQAGVSTVPGSLESFYIPQFGAIHEGWDSRRYEILNNYFKFYPACAHLHTVLQAIEQLQEIHQIDADEVERIDVHAFKGAADLDVVEPRSNLAARFSLPFTVSRLLLTGSVGDHVFSEDDLRDQRTLALAHRIHTHVDPTLRPSYPDARPVHVVVTMKDQSIHTADEHMARGESERPEPRQSWRSKVRRLVGAEADALLAFLDTEPRAWHARDLGEWLSHR